MLSEKERLSGRIANLERRAVMLRAIRAFLDREGFVEIEAPIRVPSPGVEVHLDAFEVHEGNPAPAPLARRFLITSPEYQMKRLVAGGMPRIYSLGKVFRRGEAGPHHNPEFTMLELYASTGWLKLAQALERLVGEVARAVTGGTRVGGLELEPPWQRLSVREAFLRHAGVALDGDEPAPRLREKCRAAGHRVPESGGWDDVFFTVFLDAVEPALGTSQPTLLYDWPRPLCALARETPEDPRVVERFEVFAGGLELCNAFGELTCAVEQRRRCEADLAERRARGLEVYPLDEKFLAAVADLPLSSGVAVGVDRLAMLLLGAREIREVLAFSEDEL